MRTALALAGLWMFVAVGCAPSANGNGDSSDNSTAAVAPELASPSDAVATAPTTDATAEFVPLRPERAYDNPSDTVRDFLAAVKAADDETATSLLSTAAQRDAWSNGMGITTDGFPNADFKIAEVQFSHDQTMAQVMCNGTDIAEIDGKREQKEFNCVWLLRREPHAWTIYGMASVIKGINVTLNFEKQLDMTKRLTQVDQQLRQQAAAVAAQTGEGQLPAGQHATRPGNVVR